MGSERAIISDGFIGLVIVFITLMFAPFGLLADIIASLIFSFIVLLIFIGPIIKYINKKLGTHIIPNVKIKFVDLVIVILFVSILESFAPSLIAITLIVGVILYVTFDDIVSEIKGGKWSII